MDNEPEVLREDSVLHINSILIRMYNTSSTRLLNKANNCYLFPFLIYFLKHLAISFKGKKLKTRLQAPNSGT